MRAIFSRALGALYLSAFWSMAVQVDGPIGSQAILTTGEYLGEVGPILGGWRYWQLPTLLRLDSPDRALHGGFNNLKQHLG
jgi:hypothetical protein